MNKIFYPPFFLDRALAGEPIAYVTTKEGDISEAIPSRTFVRGGVMHTVTLKDWSEMMPYIQEGVIPSFRTKAEALKAGRHFGWKTAVRVEKRFETVWVVGKCDFQPESLYDLVWDVIRLPLLRWERNEFGIEFCPVVKIRRLRKEAADK